jgi:hypothetical protein
MPPITDVREISRIGYGFMASRALFAALDADASGRLSALLTACVALGLLTLDAALRGERVDFYSQLRDPQEARAFTIVQHSGSLGPAHVVAKLVDLAGAGDAGRPGHHAAAVRAAVTRW